MEMLGIARKNAFILNFIFNPDWELYANDTNDTNLWGLRYKGVEIFPPEYDFIEPLNVDENGWGIFNICKENKCYVIDSFNHMLTNKYDIIFELAYGIFVIWDNGLYGLLNPNNGEVIIPPQYESIEYLEDYGTIKLKNKDEELKIRVKN